jgi:hypothetical protein
MNGMHDEEDGGVRLAECYWNVGVKLNVRPYRRYCQRMDRRLRKLEARFALPQREPIPQFRRNFDGKPVK